MWAVHLEGKRILKNASLQFGHTWIGHIATVCDQDDIVVDAAKLFRYLLLFDRVIIQSSRLREFTVLAGALGRPSLSTLLRSGAIGILCQALTTGQTGQSNIGGRRTPLPNGSYSFDVVREADRRAYLHACFQNVRSSRDLTFKECKRLKRDIADTLVEPIHSVRHEMEEQLFSDLRSSAPHFSTALAVDLRRSHRISVRPSDLTLKIHELGERDFRVESNLQLVTALDELACHKATERSLLAVGGLNQRLAEMNGYSAMTDFWYRDLPVLGRKLRYLSELSPERQDRLLATVLALPGLPDMGEALAQGQVDVERFLEIRDSPDGREFRRWFRSAGPDDVALLTDQWARFRNRLGAWMATPTGRAVRFLMSTGAGLVPGIGVAAGAIDTFVLERLFPQSQPMTFLQHSYRSIFRGSADDEFRVPE